MPSTGFRYSGEWELLPCAGRPIRLMVYLSLKFSASQPTLTSLKVALQMISLVHKLKKWVTRSKPKFKLGDCVQLTDGGYDPMIVINVYDSLELNHVLIECKWFDTQSKSTRTNLFLQEQLAPFDWHGAYRSLEERELGVGDQR